jgi:hypothetical protein
MKLHAFDAAGGIDISSGWTDITLDTEVVKDSIFALSGAEITINADGYYAISYYVGADVTSGTKDSKSESRLAVDTGGGYAELGGTRCPMFNKDVAEGTSNGAATVLRQFNSGDKIKIQAQRMGGTSTIVTYANACGITIEACDDSRIDNLDNIHAKMGWHSQEVFKANYRHPKDLLIYYGWPNAFNSAINSWVNEKVAQNMAKYNLIVLGDGVQDPSHGDYANTQVIIPRIKALNPNALIFGYVTVNQTLSAFQTKTDQWETLQVHGIFMDEAGYDYGKTRSEFNDRIDYVHGKTYAKLCFANAWNTDHILGTANDPSYPNTTYNSGVVESNLGINDWALLESFAINTQAYATAGNGFEPKTQWAARGTKFMGLRATYGVNFAGVGIIDNGNVGGENLASFGFISALMWSLEGWGTSDDDYAASSAAVDWWAVRAESATVNWWARPAPLPSGVWSLNPSVQNDVGNNNLYHRYVGTFKGTSKLTLDFTDDAQKGTIDMW